MNVSIVLAEDETLGPREIHELLKEPEMKQRLMDESDSGNGMRGFVVSAPDLKVLRGLPCEYEVVDESLKVAGAAESQSPSQSAAACGLGSWIFSDRSNLRLPVVVWSSLTACACGD